MFDQLRNIGPEKQSKKIVTPIAGANQKKKKTSAGVPE